MGQEEADGVHAGATLETEAPAAKARKWTTLHRSTQKQRAKEPPAWLPAMKLVTSEGEARCFVKRGGRWLSSEDSGVELLQDAGGWVIRDAAGCLWGLPAAECDSPPAAAPPTGGWRLGNDGCELSAVTKAQVAEARQRESLRPWGEWLEHLESVVGPLRGRVFDVGCGAGCLDALLVRCKELSVVGVDVDPVAAASAKMLCPRTPIRCTAVERLHEWPEDAGTASGVWASFLTQHLTQGSLRKALIELSWLLEPGGWLCLVDVYGLFSFRSPFRENRWSLDFRHLDEDLADALKPGLDVWVPMRWEEIAEDCGLEVVDRRDWADGEFVFSGAASDAQQAVWAARLDRPEVKALFANRWRQFAKEAREEFLWCLGQAEQSTNSKCKMLICRKPAR